MKLVGGDSGRYERETFIEDVLLAPSERAVVDVLFDSPGQTSLEHRTPDAVYPLGAFTVAGTASDNFGIAYTSVAYQEASSGEYFNPVSGEGLGAADFAWSSLAMEVAEPDLEAAARSYL